MHEVAVGRPAPFKTAAPGAAVLNAQVVSRPYVHGKFLYHGDQKLWLRGVTYGTFRPDADGHGYPSPERVRRDFAQMADSGLNATQQGT